MDEKIKAKSRIKLRKRVVQLPVETITDKMTNNIETILKEDEKIIKQYLERMIFTSTLSNTTNQQLETIFQNIKQSINPGNH